jgi:hypothetical protein
MAFTRHNNSRFIRAVAVLAIGSAIFLSACATTRYTAPFTAPTWAPTAAGDLSSVEYYYFPDYGLYYDAATGTYMYNSTAGWTSSKTLPSSVGNADLNNSYVVMLGPNTVDPWTNNAFYSANYPSAYYNVYPDIITGHTLISGLPADYSVVPRAFNESTNQVIFQQRMPDGTLMTGTTAYNAVPMSSISPYMPAESQNYNYGAGVKTR